MATQVPAAQSERVGSQEDGSKFSLSEAAIAAVAAVIFTVVFAPLLTYGTSIIGFELGLNIIVVLSAFIGVVVSLLEQGRR